MRKHLINIIVFIFLLYSTNSQDPESITFLRNLDGGLPSRWVGKVGFDSKGRVWAPTQMDGYIHSGGLAMYDGVSWTVYDTTNSEIPSRNLMSLVIDHNDTKWIESDIGLIKMQGNSFELIETVHDTIELKYIKDMEIDKDGNLWLLMPYKKILRYNGVEWFEEELPIKDFEFYTEMTFDRNNDIWVGTDRGLFHYDGVDILKYDTSNTEFPKNRIHDVMVDSNNHIWVSQVGEYLMEFDGDSWVKHKYPELDKLNYDIRIFAVDRNNTKWFMTRGKTGLLSYDGSEWEFFSRDDYNFPTGRYYDLSIDELGNKWMATDSGLCVFQEGGVKGITGVEDEQRANFSKKLKVFPNPAEENVRLNYNLETAGKVEITLHDGAGNVVRRLNAGFAAEGANSVEFETEGLPTGVYYYNIQVDGQMQSGKFILSK